MGTVSIHTVITATLGSEKVRTVRNTTKTIGSQKHDQIATVADNNGEAILWSAATSPIDTFSMAVIQVDPDDTYADDAAVPVLTIEFQGDGTAISSFAVRREAPLILTSDDMGADIDNLDEVIDTITAKNENADDAGDVDVRIILFT